jgi:hypothetical protein
MNTVYFITDTVYCEASPATMVCRLFRKSLTDLNVPFVTLDLHTSAKEIVSFTESLGIGKILYSPYILILDSNNSVVFHFNGPYLAELAKEAGDDMSNLSNLDSIIQKHMKDVLTLYGAIASD